MENRFKPGDIVQHFKREMLSDEEREGRKYLYEITGVALHSETREEMMVYRPLYDDGGLFVRPLEMFLSEVDREKYPQIRQKYRFEKILTVPLRLIHDAVEMANGEWHQFLDAEKMEIASIPDDPYLYGDEDEFEELARDINEAFGTRYFRLPEESEIDGNRMMKDFVRDMPEGEIRDYLLGEIGQKGAYRRFREGIRRYGIEQSWYDYRDAAYWQIARDWCDKNGISYTE